MDTWCGPLRRSLAEDQINTGGHQPDQQQLPNNSTTTLQVQQLQQTSTNPSITNKLVSTLHAKTNNGRRRTSQSVLSNPNF
jgi:hypothetical protein